MFKSLKKDILIFLVIFIIQSCVSIFFLQCPDWDFYNYHYYIGYAFLNDRLGTDFLAANFHSCYSPFVDAFNYLLIKYLNNHPYVFLSIASFDNVLLLFMVYKITDYLILYKNNFLKGIFVLLSVVYVAYSPILIDGYNYSMNDVSVANFTLICFYLFIKNIFINSLNRNKLICLSGVFLGIGLALKYTGYVYFITIILSVLLFRKKIPCPYKTAFLFIMSVLLTFILLGGYWLYIIWKLFNNPVFPYFNNIFHSKYYDYTNMFLLDYWFIRPKNLIEFIFYPFLFSHEFYFGSFRMDWDNRYAVYILSSVLIIFYSLFSNKNFMSKISELINPNNLYLILFFCLFSYYLNILLIGVYRFIIPTSSLFGIVLLAAVFLIAKKLFPNSINLFSIIIFSVILIFAYTNSFCTTHHKITLPKKNAKLFYNDEKFNITDNSYVIFLNNQTSYLAVGQNKNAKYYGFVIPSHIFKQYKDYIYNYEPLVFYASYMYSKYLENLLLNIISDNNNKIYVIYTDLLYFDEVYKKSLDYYSKGARKLENCRDIGYKGILYFDYYQSHICEYI